MKDLELLWTKLKEVTDGTPTMTGKKTGQMGRIGRSELTKPQNFTASSINRHSVENFEVRACYESCGVSFELHSLSWT
jgi:hypothetical protein